MNPCRPGYGASCALCCGSHNFRAPRREIESLLTRRAGRASGFSLAYLISHMRASRSAMTGSYYYAPPFQEQDALSAADPQGTRCPYVAVIGDEKIAGCLLHGGMAEVATRDCFLSYNGKTFSCAVRELTGSQVLYAAALFRDWYWYPLLIHCPELLREIMEEFPSPEAAAPERVALLKCDLAARLAASQSLFRVSNYFG